MPHFVEQVILKVRHVPLVAQVTCGIPHFKKRSIVKVRNISLVAQQARCGRCCRCWPPCSSSARRTRLAARRARPNGRLPQVLSTWRPSAGVQRSCLGDRIRFISAHHTYSSVSAYMSCGMVSRGQMQCRLRLTISAMCFVQVWGRKERRQPVCWAAGAPGSWPAEQSQPPDDLRRTYMPGVESLM